MNIYFMCIITASLLTKMEFQYIEIDLLSSILFYSDAVLSH